MNTPQARMLQTKKPPGLEYYVPHYLNLIWRWKWYIIIVTPIVFIGWSFAAVKYGNSTPELETKATVQFDQSSNRGLDGQILASQAEGREAYIRSRSFLQGIVERLSLQLAVQKYSRSDIFDSIAIDKSTPVGKYDLIVKKGMYTFLFTNKNKGIEKRVIRAGSIPELQNLSFSSTALTLTRDFMLEPHSVSFSVEYTLEGVNRILKNLSIRFIGQQASVMVITLKGTDYPLITQIANTIANDFVMKSTAMKQTRKSDNAQALENQLQSARYEMDQAGEAIRRFREANPTVGISSLLGSSVTEISSLDGSVATMKRSIDEAKTLQSKCAAASAPDDQITNLYEAVTFLASHQSVAAQALQIALNDLTAEKRSVDANYAPQHPIAIENRKKIARLVANISNALSDIITKMTADASGVETRRTSIAEDFQKLPEKELRYAELERKRQVAQDLYTGVFARYNAGKLSESESSSRGAFVVDQAVVPVSPGRLQSLLQLLMIGAIVAFGIGFGPAVGLDYLDKRARNESDCRRFSTLPFLEGIPLKVSSGNKKKPDKGKLDECLVAAGFEPDVFDEMYRSLRTKILLHLQSEAHKMLVVTSLNVAEGKSLTASNLSIVMAQQKLRTLLIDGDMRKGVQHHSFVLEKKPGLSELLSSPDDLITLPINTFLQKTHIPNLSLLSCGMPIPNPAECMNSNKFRNLATVLTKWFDVVVLDTPPLRVAVDAAILPEAFDHYIIVARAAKTSLDALEKKVNDFPGLRQKVLGIVLNGSPVDKKMYNYAYSYYRH